MSCCVFLIHLVLFFGNKFICYHFEDLCLFSCPTDNYSCYMSLKVVTCKDKDKGAFVVVWNCTARNYPKIKWCINNFALNSCNYLSLRKCFKTTNWSQVTNFIDSSNSDRFKTKINFLLTSLWSNIHWTIGLCMCSVSNY